MVRSVMVLVKVVPASKRRLVDVAEGLDAEICDATIGWKIIKIDRMKEGGPRCMLTERGIRGKTGKPSHAKRSSEERLPSARPSAFVRSWVEKGRGFSSLFGRNLINGQPRAAGLIFAGNEFEFESGRLDFNKLSTDMHQRSYR